VVDQDGSVDMGDYNLWIRFNNEGGCFDYNVNSTITTY